MSPEQAKGGRELDERSDIYSLGAVAYYLLTGRPPFEGDDGIAVMIAHARDPVVPPSQVRTGIPEDLERVVLRCLAKDPAERFPNAEGLERALGECAARGIGTNGVPPGGGTQTGPRRHRRPSTDPASTSGEPRLDLPIVGGHQTSSSRGGPSGKRGVAFLWGQERRTAVLDGGTHRKSLWTNRSSRRMPEVVAPTDVWFKQRAVPLTIREILSPSEGCKVHAIEKDQRVNFTATFRTLVGSRIQAIELQDPYLMTSHQVGSLDEFLQAIPWTPVAEAIPFKLLTHLLDSSPLERDQLPIDSSVPPVRLAIPVYSRCLTPAAVEVRQSFGDRLFRHGIDGLRCDLGQRLQDESSGRVPRMGHDQFGRVDDPIVEEEQVEVQGPLAPPHGPNPDEPGLNLLEETEDGKWVERRLDDDGGVEVLPLSRRTAHRLGLVERADLSDAHTWRPGQRGDRTLQRGPTVAQVAPQSDQSKGRGHR